MRFLHVVGITKECLYRAREMDDGRLSFYVMSSVNEYWTRASESDRSQIKTSSSDDSAHESDPSGKVYQDTSCYVDFEDESNGIENENPLNVVANASEMIHLSDSAIKKNPGLELPRYVCWDVLMSLGLGLWASLCIVDGLQSEKPAGRGWFFEFTSEKQSVPEIATIKRPETHVSWLSIFWPHLWGILWIFSYGGACFLLILIFIIFCTDPKLQKANNQSTIQNNSDTTISTSNEVENSIAENLILSNRQKLLNLWIVRPVVSRVVPVKLAPSSPIHFAAQDFLNAEQRFFHCNTIQICYPIFQRKIASVSTVLQLINHCPSECKKSSILNRKNVHGQLYITNCGILKLANMAGNDTSSVAGTSATMTFVDSSTSTFSSQKIDFEVEEYSTKTKKSSYLLKILKKRTERNPTASSNNAETRMQIITSSPDFKNFLSRLKHKSFVS